MVGYVEAYRINENGTQTSIYSGSTTIYLENSLDGYYNILYNVKNIVDNDESSTITLDDVLVTEFNVNYTIYPRAGADEYSTTRWYFTVNKQILTIAISYELNGGVRIDGYAPGNYTHINGTTFILPTNVNRPGYKIRGFTGPYEGTALPGDTIYINFRRSGVITALYDASYIYDFDLNGGSQTAGSAASTTKLYGDTVTLPTANKPFHTFSYYETTPNIGNVNTMGATVTITGNIKYTMIWTTDTFYNIRSPVTYNRPVYIPKTFKEVYSNLERAITPISINIFNITLSPAISARSQHSMVSLSNDIYIFGGFNGTTLLNDFYKINTINCNVTTIYNNDNTRGISKRYGHSMVAINNDIYIFGGYDNTNTLNDFYKINTLTCNVTYSNNNFGISKRYAHSMVGINNDIYIFGGYDGANVLNDFYKINILNCNITTIYNNNNNLLGISKRSTMGMVAINSNIYIYGGTSNNNALNDFYKIDTTTNNIIYNYSNFGIPSRSANSMTALNNDVYIFGGYINTTLLNDFYKINTNPFNTTTLYSNNDENNIITNRYSHSMVTVNNDMYIFGGNNNNGYLSNFYKISKTDITL